MAPSASPTLPKVGAAPSIITSDATRAVPNRELLPAVVAELHAAGIGDDAIEVVIGTGAHRGATPAELREMLGEEWIGRLRVANHDARGDTVAVGTTARGNEVLVDRRVAEAGVRIALGLVEAHEFAGFTGGPKAILPAVCGYDTIVRNHSIAMMSHPGARPGVLEQNPIHEEMCEAARSGAAGLRRQRRPRLAGCGRSPWRPETRWRRRPSWCASCVGTPRCPCPATRPTSS